MLLYRRFVYWVFALRISFESALGWIRSSLQLRRISYGLSASVLLFAHAGPGHSTIIGLGNGTYDVTLTCLLINCGPYTGSLSVAGNDGTAWTFDAAVAGTQLSFVGNPIEQIIGPPLDLEFLRGSAASPNLMFELEITNSTLNGLPSWNINVGGVALAYGNWTAAPVTSISIPEPSPLILMLFGVLTFFTRTLSRKNAI